MSVAEMKKVIHEKVEHLNDEKALVDVLELLNKQIASDAIDAAKYMNQLFAENDGLLKRLA